MNIINKKIDAIISESIRRTINEISLDTLEKANDRAGVEGNTEYIENEKSTFGYNEVSDAIQMIRRNLGYFPNSKEALQCQKYLDGIKRFFIRKAKQKENFEDEFQNRSDAAKSKLTKMAADIYGKNRIKGDYADLNDDEWSNVSKKIGNDKDLKWAYNNY